MENQNSRQGKIQNYHCHAKKLLLSISTVTSNAQGGDPEQKRLRMTTNYIGQIVPDNQTNCHSRMSLSGIPTLEKTSGGDPRQQPSGMTHKNNSHSKLDLESHPMSLRNDEILNPVIYKTPYKNTTGRAPAVKAAVQDDEGRTVKGNVGQVLPDNKGCSPRPLEGKDTRRAGEGNIREEALNKNTFRAPLRSGFTLIELLVVVLIIAVLAAVALPQYQLAVDKARFMQLVTAAKAVQNAQEVYYLTHGHYTQNWNELDIAFSGTVDNRVFTNEQGLKLTLMSNKNSASNPDGVYATDTRIKGAWLLTAYVYSPLLPNAKECWAGKANAHANQLCKSLTKRKTWSRSSDGSVVYPF